MTDLNLFDYSGRQVRTVQVDGEPWFVAADVCAALDISNPRQAVSYLDADEVALAPVTTNDGSGRTLPTNIVNESGLYSMIFRSRKAEAKAFKRWVTHEVLPSIRKHGGYINPVATAEQLDELRKKADVLRALVGFVDAGYLDAKGRILAAQALGETPQLDQKTKPLTVSIYLHRKGIKGKELKAVQSVFGRRLKAAYIEVYGEAPPTIENVEGRHTIVVAQYQQQHSYLFDQVWAKYYGGAA